MKQRQFLDVLERDEAERRWRAAIDAAPRPPERVPLDRALGRVLAEDVRAEVDVPGFDRANLDGFAVRAEDCYGASEEGPRKLLLDTPSIVPGVVPIDQVRPGRAIPIATGGMLPRGADAVVPVEDTDAEGKSLWVRRATTPGAAVSFAGTDIGAGETVLFAGTPLSSRDTGVLAAIGRPHVTVVRTPRVAILSTGDELVQPGQELRPGCIYDSNGRILGDAVRELGGEPHFLGAFRDELGALRKALWSALDGDADLVLLSGGTSKGEGDLNAQAVAELDPGIVVHGVALKPGKPICLAAHRRKPVVILPGFPTSAIFTFHEFVAPVLCAMGARPARRDRELPARLALRIPSERGRLEYLLVSTTREAGGELVAYPMGKGSGSVTAFSRADGFVRLPRNVEIAEAGEALLVTPIGIGTPLADLVLIGSHCVGLDRIAGALQRAGVRAKFLATGSLGGLAAARRGECDAAPIHLLEPASEAYNTPFLDRELRLLSGYRRMQGVVTRATERRPTASLLDDPTLRMVNRNRGSGTRILIDQLLGERRPPGYAHQPRSHCAVAAAIAQGRADWGVSIESAVRGDDLYFRPLRAEHYDFAVPTSRWDRPALRVLRQLLRPGSELRAELAELGFGPPEASA